MPPRLGELPPWHRSSLEKACLRVTHARRDGAPVIDERLAKQVRIAEDYGVRQGRSTFMSPCTFNTFSVIWPVA